MVNKIKINIPAVVGTVIACVLVFSVFAYADWRSPSAGPPACDIAQDEGCNTPVNTGVRSQVKAGALGVEGLFQVGTQGEISLVGGPGSGPIGINVGLSGGAKRFISFIPWGTVKTEFGMENVTGFINTIETSGGAAPNLEIRRNGAPIATFNGAGLSVNGTVTANGTVYAPDVNLTNPAYSATVGVTQPGGTNAGERAVMIDSPAMCPPGYFLYGVQFGTRSGNLILSGSCGKL